MDFNTRLSPIVAVSLLIVSCSSTVAERTAAGQIVVSHQGVGGISQSTPYDVDEIQSLFPELSVSKTIENVELEWQVVESRRIDVFDGDIEIMSIYGYVDGKVLSISSESTQVTTPDGYTVGAALMDVFPTGIEEVCTVPINYQGPARQYLVCRYPPFHRITYFFSGNWAEDFTEMPSPESLEGATLQRITWDGDS